MRFQIRIASLVIEADTIYASARDYCQFYLTEGNPDFSVTITPEDITIEREKAVREDIGEGLPVRNLLDPPLDTTALQRKLAEGLFRRNVLLGC